MNTRNINLIGEMNELMSATCCIEGLAEAEQRITDPRERREIQEALIESLKAVQFLASDIRRKLPSIEIETETFHA